MNLKINIIIIAIPSLLFMGCDSRKTIKKEPAAGIDLSAGIITKPESLTCDDIWLSVEGERTDRVTFYYGEKFDVNFNNMKGFKSVSEKVFPGMMLKVIDESGDTIFRSEDLYADHANGIDFSPLSLKASFSVENPLHSNQNYILFIQIWDKSGDGIFITEAPFSVTENERIKIEKKNISYAEIYLFSANRNEVITDGIIAFDEVVYLVFEGLSGFEEKNGKVYPGARVRAIDNLNAPVMYFGDLFDSYTTTGIDSDEFKARIYVKMAFSGVSVENPVHCEAVIFDKKSKEGYIKVTTELTVN